MADLKATSLALAVLLVFLHPYAASARCIVIGNTAPDGTIDSPASPPTINAGQSVTFEGSATDDGLPAPPSITYLWDFPDGTPNSSTDQSPVPIVYSSEIGSPFTATLTVSDGLLDDPSPDTLQVTVLSAATCGTWDDCDGFDTDSIAGGDWAAEGLGTWAIAGGDLTNVYAVSNGLSRLRRTVTPMDADNCQVIQVSSDDTVQSAPGLVMRSTSTNWASASWIEVIIVEDVPTIEVNLTTYTNGTSNGQESSFALGDTPPFWFGACIAGSGGSTEIDVFTWASEPSSDTSTWDAALVDTLTHDGTPVVDTNAANGFRNYRESPASGTLEIGYWEAINDVYTPPPSMALSKASIPVVIEVGSGAADQVVDVENAGGGTFGWTSAIVGTVEDCTAGGGGTDWIAVSTVPALGSGAYPETVTFHLADETSDQCDEGDTYTATFRFTADAGTPATIDIAVNLTVNAIGAAVACNDGIDNDGDWNGGVDPDPGGGVDYPDDLGCWGPEDPDENFADVTSTGPYLADGTTLRGQCATLPACSGGLSTQAGNVSTSSDSQVIECLDFTTSGANIAVNHDDVTVRCVRMAAGTSENEIFVNGVDGTVIQDVEINGGLSPGEGLITFQNGTTNVFAENVELRRWDDGFAIRAVDGWTVRNSWVHLPRTEAGCKCGAPNETCEHNDGFEIDGPSSDGVAEGIHAQADNSEAICITSPYYTSNWSGGHNNEQLRRSYINQGGTPNSTWSSWCDGQNAGSTDPFDLMTYIDNVWETGTSGYYVAQGTCSNLQDSGNVDYATGAQVGGADARLECNDGVDNDGDGKIDYGVFPLTHSDWNDPGCTDGWDNSENTQ